MLNQKANSGFRCRKFSLQMFAINRSYEQNLSLLQWCWQRLFVFMVLHNNPGICNFLHNQQISAYFVKFIYQVLTQSFLIAVNYHVRLEIHMPTSLCFKPKPSTKVREVTTQNLKHSIGHRI